MTLCITKNRYILFTLQHAAVNCIPMSMNVSHDLSAKQSLLIDQTEIYSRQ